MLQRRPALPPCRGSFSPRSRTRRRAAGGCPEALGPDRTRGVSESSSMPSTTRRGGFYEHHGFTVCAGESRRLYLPIDERLRRLASHRNSSTPFSRQIAGWPDRFSGKSPIWAGDDIRSNGGLLLHGAEPIAWHGTGAPRTRIEVAIDDVRPSTAALDQRYCCGCTAIPARTGLAST
jgi:hypothetical protein